MGVNYQAVGWNRQKRIYDLTLLGGVVLYLAVFIGLGAVLHPAATAETHIIRGLGTAALILLHIILAIGPLCRINDSFLPLLYNRRHMGVTMFILALGHGAFATIQFHALGDLNPLVSILVSNTEYASLSQFPFQPLGLFALIILFMMAATSHDFWMANLTAPVWKALHMLVYVAYALIIAHVALGVLQAETSPILAIVMALGFVGIFGLHFVAARQETGKDVEVETVPDDDGYMEVCGVDEIEEKCAQIVTVGGERVAIFKYDGKISAVSNVCQHQNGPLGEGRIIDGCITCPWHGYQYRPTDGRSPEPFTEKIPTFNVQVRDRRVFIRYYPNLPGTYAEPARIDEEV